MIICHCANITDRDIDAAVDWMRAADPFTVITPGKVYRALGKAPDCGGCVPSFLRTMRDNPNLEVPVLDRQAIDATMETPKLLRDLRGRQSDKE